MIRVPAPQPLFKTSSKSEDAANTYTCVTPFATDLHAPEKFAKLSNMKSPFPFRHLRQWFAHNFRPSDFYHIISTPSQQHGSGALRIPRTRTFARSPALSPRQGASSMWPLPQKRRRSWLPLMSTDVGHEILHLVILCASGCKWDLIVGGCVEQNSPAQTCYGL